MSRVCKLCGSYAINPRSHGRTPGVDEHLCDVCYWRVRAGRALEELEALRAAAIRSNDADQPRRET